MLVLHCLWHNNSILLTLDVVFFYYINLHVIVCSMESTVMCFGAGYRYRNFKLSGSKAPTTKTIAVRFPRPTVLGCTRYAHYFSKKKKRISSAYDVSGGAHPVVTSLPVQPSSSRHGNLACFTFLTTRRLVRVFPVVRNRSALANADFRSYAVRSYRNRPGRDRSFLWARYERKSSNTLPFICALQFDCSYVQNNICRSGSCSIDFA